MEIDNNTWCIYYSISERRKFLQDESDFARNFMIKNNYGITVGHNKIIAFFRHSEDHLRRSWLPEFKTVAMDLEMCTYIARSYEMWRIFHATWSNRVWPPTYRNRV